ncbi:MAG: glutaminyl-tRNA synthase (glutamine-hydrolyzing) subunit B [Deltaproteobacteria bacterium RBG_16_66_15]|nr:MAG: glutaminyl-tRNA synthase (glutamine-hydrolyzing) subunit B [Deltaproteobacteria bacterium GWA2_65_63]OGP27053.1 MAG: glutaminyl-tRNA synthase (glutamine-hydrolyzing) subunit B [Deltaproteobacteria bacterium GWB2_65_81]OGP40094.1 MAG: glutaminyl-tRNA synthase (glutamine-hydrolyzing) subunit B [Deltaproteobacteria bacterium GWC2_66_88]OGP79223.1 MAG: glutaminyl-tRNA synthase (glutamine-hydrolyzing) subunit B [Deltaproteobacteria bacterium RBG_16_66_15]
MAFEAVIGLEVHAQLSTRSKIFCACSAAFGASPNENTCPVCTGMPGVLPVLNRRAVEYTIRTAIATSSTVQRRSVFARKNYFYPDLPKAYQISQYELPIALGGHIDIETGNGPKRIGITRIHMEEDAGKLVHEGEFAGAQASLADLNRCSVPLMEIVSEPDMRTPEEGGAYLRRLHDILVYLGVCDGNMEEGSFRCDANVSVRPAGQESFGTKAELKNMNSFRNVEKALEYEIRRQIERIEDGGKVVQETRLWDANAGVTVAMRRKEEAHDYRYFPDPDLLPLIVDESWVEELRKTIPELPAEKIARLERQYGIPRYDAGILAADRALADFFEASAAIYGGNPKTTANECVHWKDAVFSGALSPETIAHAVEDRERGTISATASKKLVELVLSTGKPFRTLRDEQGLTQVSDASALDVIVEKILAASPKEVESYRGGKVGLLSFFVGQVMRESRGKANPKVVQEVLKRKLG